MGYFETNDMLDEQELPPPAEVVAPPRPTTNRTFTWLVGIIALLCLVMLSINLLQGKAQQVEIDDLNSVASLNTYSHLLYSAALSGSRAEQLPLLHEIDKIRTHLRFSYPGEVHSTDPAWDRFAISIERTNTVSQQAADLAFQSTAGLAAAIRQNYSEKFREGIWLYVAGALAVVFLILKVHRTEHENIIGRISLHLDRSFSTSVLDSLEEGILACDANGRLTLINTATREFHGIERRQVPPDNWAGHFVLYTSDGSREFDRTEHPLVRALAGEQIADLEVLVVSDSGHPRYCVINGRSIMDEDGGKLGAVIVMHDISDRRRAEQEAMRLASIVECSADAILGVNLDGFLVSWNAAATQLYGFDPQDVLGRHASVLDQEGELDAVGTVIKALLKGEKIETVESSLIKKDGTRVEVSLTYSLIKDAKGVTIGISTTARDITVRKRAEEALKESQSRLSEAQRVARMGSWEFDPATQQVIWSDQMYELYQFDPSKGSPSYIDVLRRHHSDDFKTVRTVMDRAVNSGISFEIDVRIVQADSSVRHCQMLGQPIIDAAGNVVRLIGTVMDISERKKAEQSAKEANIALEFQKKALEEANLRLESLATSDGLTGLRNRRALDAHLEQEFARSSRYKAQLSLLLLDIDKFKTYNDSFGHQAGDEVLRMVAKVLTNGTRESDIVARYGGEELCIVLPETPFVEAGRIAERLRNAVQRAPWDRREVTVSIGVSTFVPGMKNCAELLLAADQALYVSKAEGRNKVTLAPDPTSPQLAAA